MNLDWLTSNRRRFHPAPELVERVEQWLEHRDDFSPLLTAFSEELSRGRLQRSLRNLAKHLSSGVDAAELCRSRAVVSTLMPLLVCDAKRDSAVQHLNRVLGESLLEEHRRRRRWRVMAYPVSLVGLALLIMGFLSLTVTPVFENIFDDFDLELPWLTTAVIELSHLFLDHPLVLASCVAGGLGGICFGWRYLMAYGPLFLGKLIASFTSGNSRSVASMAAFARRLAEGLAARLPVLVALRVAGETNPSLFLRRMAFRLANESCAASVASEIVGNVRLASLNSSTWFPATMVYLLDHEESDRSITSRRLHDYADLLAERVESRFEWSTGIVAQASVAMAGAVVALVLIALMLPLVNLVSGLT